MSGCGCCACLAGAGEHPPVYNRPGLGALRYRIGTHRTFFDAMLRRLTVPVLDDGEPYSLHRLSTRESDDPSIALLDAWATVGDVLTFYQERIANEGFLATATERRSILELGRLVGYTLKPGVAASVYLAYTLDDGAKTIIPAGTKAQSVPGADEKPQTFETSADTEARAAWNALRPRMRRPQNITLENVLAIDSVWIAGTQTRLDRREPLFFVFETDMKRFDKSEPPKTKPGTTEVHAMRRVREVIVDDAHDRTRIVLEPLRPYYTALYDAVLPVWRGMTHPPVVEDPCRREKPPEPPPVGDEPMVVEAPRKRRKKKAAGDEPLMLEAQALVLDVDRLLRDLLLGVQRMTLQSLHGHRTGPDPLPELILAADADPLVVQGTGGPSSIEEFLTPLKTARGNAPASQWAMGRSLQRSVGAESDFVPRLLGAFFPRVDAALYTALSNLATGDVPYDELRSVHVMRRQARVFGYNAPPALFEDRPTPEDPKFPKPGFVVEEDTVMHLSAAEELAVPGGYAVIVNHEGAKARKILEAQTKPRGGYAVSGDSTRLAFNAYWWCPNLTDSIANMTDNLGTIRSTNVFVASERVTLAQQAVDRPVGRAAADDDDAESKTRIELDGVVEGLTAGRYVIVTGVRADTHGTGGVVSAEVAMVANVELRGDAGPGGTPYSILDLAPDGLAYEYVRTTVKILGNVVKATHGETRHQILGAGDASKPLQTFGLQQSPLTFVSAPTVDGVASTLVVRVNDVRWHETDSFAGASPNERVFVTDISDEGKVAVTFGTGREGARLPTGTDNVRATYRSGIGRAGNV
ncbi:MAG TPA: hypothetical protein VND45_13735, partial [Thermoanaerobaculia bacterium]|nr:hypothetical protein [Thermoanaerobaculia bacterium]